MKNKEKYDLRDISYTLNAGNGGYDFVIYCNLAEIYRENFYGINSVGGAFTKWLEEEYIPNILTEKEKAYLSAVIKPFRERTIFVKKVCCMNDEKEFIYVEFGSNCFTFPFFTKGTMYKGMKLNKPYTLEDLGL